MDIVGAQTSILDYYANEKGGGRGIGVAMVGLAWAAGMLGWSWSCVLCIALFAYTYWFQQTRRMRRAIKWNLNAAMREPSVARAVMGTDLPTWINMSPIEKCSWLQALLDNVWPYISGPTQSSLTHALTPLLERYRPKALLTVLELGYFDLGDIPPTIEGVQVSSTPSGTSTLIDMNISWKGNPDIRIMGVMGAVEVEASLNNLQLRALVRLSLGPHCSKWPCFSAMSISFVGKPQIDYHLRAAKISLDAIPGFAKWLDGFIVMMAGMLLYPRRLVIPIHSMPAEQHMDGVVEPVGCVILEIKKASNLPEGGVFKGATYVRVTSSMGDDRRSLSYRTKTVKGTNPNYEESHEQQARTEGKGRMGFKWFKGHDTSGSQTHLMQFPVYNVPGEQLLIEVLWSRSAQNQFMNKLMLQDGSLVGRINLQMGSLTGGRYDACSRLMSAHNSGAHTTTRLVEDLGTLTFSTNYRAFVEPNLDAPKPQGRRPEDIGMVIADVVRAQDLPVADMNGSSDGYVVVRVGRHEARTDTVYASLNPQFNTVLYINVNASDLKGNSKVEVSVYDEDQFKKHDRLGRFTLPISQLLAEPSLVLPVLPYAIEEDYGGRVQRGVVHVGFKLKLFAPNQAKS